MGLTCKTQIITDFREAPITVGQQTFCFFQFTSDNVCTNIDTEFFFEMTYHIRTATVYAICNV